MPFRIYPTVSEVIETHRLLIQEFGGLDGVRDRGLLESAVFRPRSGYYADIIEEAAALLESLTNTQAFVDRNKRVAFAMTDAMLRANGYFLDVDGQEAYQLMMEATMRKEFRFSWIRDWIASIVKLA